MGHTDDMDEMPTIHEDGGDDDVLILSRSQRSQSAVPAASARARVNEDRLMTRARVSQQQQAGGGGAAGAAPTHMPAVRGREEVGAGAPLADERCSTLALPGSSACDTFLASVINKVMSEISKYDKTIEGLQRTYEILQSGPDAALFDDHDRDMFLQAIDRNVVILEKYRNILHMAQKEETEGLKTMAANVQRRKQVLIQCDEQTAWAKDPTLMAYFSATEKAYETKIYDIQNDLIARIEQLMDEVEQSIAAPSLQVAAT